MSEDVVDLRKGARFVLHSPVEGTFGPADVTTLNIGLAGSQIAHEQPLRIGTRGRFQFRRGDISINVTARVVWSHLSKTGGGFAYVSGLKFDVTEPALAAAINALYRSGAVHQDNESLDRKRERLQERMRDRLSAPRAIPMPAGADGPTGETPKG